MQATLNLVALSALFTVAQSVKLCSDCWYSDSTNYFNNGGTSCGASAKGLTNTLTTCTASTCADIESPSANSTTEIALGAGGYCTFTVNLAAYELTDEQTNGNITLDSAGFYFTGGLQGFCWMNDGSDSDTSAVVTTRSAVDSTATPAIDITGASSDESLIETDGAAATYFCQVVVPADSTDAVTGTFEYVVILEEPEDEDEEGSNGFLMSLSYFTALLFAFAQLF